MQDIQDECGRVAQELRMQVPLQVSSQTDDNSPVYSALVTAALTPTKFIPETPTLRVSNPSSPVYRCDFIAFNLFAVVGLSLLQSHMLMLPSCQTPHHTTPHHTPHHTTPHHTTPHHTTPHHTTPYPIKHHIIHHIVSTHYFNHHRHVVTAGKKEV